MKFPPGCMGMQPALVRGPCGIGVDVRPSSWDCAVCDLVQPREGLWVKRLVFYGKVPDEKHVEFVARQYRVRVGCCDSRPDGTLALRLQKAMLRMHVDFWRCQYATYSTEIKVKENREERLLTLDRTKTLDDVHWDFQTAMGWLIPQNFLEIGRTGYLSAEGRRAAKEMHGVDVMSGGADFASELKASTKILTTQHGRPAYVWTEGVDHTFHALNLLKVAIDQGNLQRFGGTAVVGPVKGIVGRTLEDNLEDDEDDDGRFYGRSGALVTM